MKLVASIAITLSLAFGLMMPIAVSAQDIGLRHGAASGLKATDPRITVARIINVALSLLGIITVIVIVYAGFMWMTSGGNTEQVGKAKHILSAAVVGLIIIMTAWAITNFVLRNLYKATTGNTYQESATLLSPGTN